MTSPFNITTSDVIEIAQGRRGRGPSRASADPSITSRRPGISTLQPVCATPSHPSTSKQLDG